LDVGHFSAVVSILTRLVPRAVTVVTMLVTGMACVPTSAPLATSAGVAPPFYLSLLDTVVLPTVTTPPEGDRAHWFGSLSGLALDPRSGRYLAVIDDRQPSRVTWLDIAADAGRLMVRRGEVFPLRPGPGVDEALVVGADLEALVALEDGTWIATEEGHASAGETAYPPGSVWQPALLTFTSEFIVTRVQPWPPRFTLGAAAGGVRSNQGFESLTRTPDGRLIAGLEQPLHADLSVTPRNGRPYGGGQGGPSRLIELVKAGGGWQPRREWIYPLDPTVTRAGEAICNDGESGLTDLLAIDDRRLIALERSCLQAADPPSVRNTARIYLVDPSAATDVARLSGAALGTARPAIKTLLVDFDALVPQFPPALAKLDNFEALAFGPHSPDGGRTLIVMSDDNFRPTQNTVFVWMEVQEAGGRR
jgi:hypothetical protein